MWAMYMLVTCCKWTRMNSTLVGLGVKLSIWAIFVKFLVLGISGNAYLWWVHCHMVTWVMQVLYAWITCWCLSTSCSNGKVSFTLNKYGTSTCTQFIMTCYLANVCFILVSYMLMFVYRLFKGWSFNSHWTSRMSTCD
jgi:hypothetical protein